MHGAPDALSDESFAQRLSELARRASTEIAPADETLLPVILGKLPAGTTLYIAHPPKTDLDEVVRVAVRAQSMGFQASPHIVARLLESAGQLRSALRELKDGGVEQILLVAGDIERPVGPFASTLDVIASDVLAEAALPCVGFAGHPEGHKAIGPTILRKALQMKQQFARGTQTRAHIVTQFGFNPAALCAWGSHLAATGITLPIHAGIMGPTPLPRLIDFAMRCGVRASLGALIGNMSAMSAPGHVAVRPDEMLCGLLRSSVAHPAMRLARVHFYSLGGAVATATWLRAVADRRFELQRSSDRLRMLA